MRTSGHIAAAIVVIGAAVGLLSFAIGNHLGQPKLLAQGTVVQVKHSYDSAHKGSRWKIKVRIAAGEDRVSHMFRPDWARKGEIVQVTYQVGRWVKDVHITRVEKVGA